MSTLSVRLQVRGLQIDTQCGKGGVVNLTVRAQEKHQGIWRRLRQYFANALFCAGDACHPGDNHRALRVVLRHVSGAAVNDGLANRADADIREVWPLHSTNGDAHYMALLVHEGVKRHHDGRCIASERGFFGGKKGADDSHFLTPVAKTRNVAEAARAITHRQAGFARLGLINTALVTVLALILSTGYLLDGPSELDAIQATADSKQDAIKSAATQASNTPARGRKDYKTVVAGVQP